MRNQARTLSCEAKLHLVKWMPMRSAAGGKADASKMLAAATSRGRVLIWWLKEEGKGRSNTAEQHFD